MGINAFITPRGATKQDFCRAFLASPDFSVRVLRTLGGSGAHKHAVATSIANLIASGHQTPTTVALALAREPRRWLTLQRGAPRHHPKLAAVDELLWGPGTERWYGPLVDGDRRWYFHPFFGTTYVKDAEDEVTAERFRWLCVAEVAPTYAAITWDGFTYAENETFNSHAQYPCWKFVKTAFDELTSNVGGSWQYPNLHDLVMHTLMNKYAFAATKYRWKHLRIRAEASGVALNARSAGSTKELEVEGLRALSTRLASAAVAGLGAKATKEQLASVENRILFTLIREWGTKSYEFSLDANEPLFRGHVYFGLDKDGETEDSYPHVLCYAPYGASTGALKFLNEHIS